MKLCLMNITEDAELKLAHIYSHQCLFCCLYSNYFNQSGSAPPLHYKWQGSSICSRAGDSLPVTDLLRWPWGAGRRVAFGMYGEKWSLGGWALGASTDTAGGRWSHDKQAFINEETGLSDPSIFHSLSSCWRCAEHVTCRTAALWWQRILHLSLQRLSWSVASLHSCRAEMISSPTLGWRHHS